jgi:hypothetical protein
MSARIEPEPAMSFREKIAWVSLAAFGFGFIVYFWSVIRVLAGKRSIGVVPELLVLGAMIVIPVLLQLAIALRSRGEARTPKDEREALIDLKATQPAFLVLLISAFASIGTMHLPVAGQWSTVHLKLLRLGVMLSITLAGVVKFAIQLALYRRDR